MYYRPETEQTFETHSEIRRSFRQSIPRVLDDTTLEGLGVYLVAETAQSVEREWWQDIEFSGVVETGGVWSKSYTLSPVFDTQEEQDTYVAQKQQEKYDATKLALTDAVQKRLDDFAATRNYMGILSLCTYATSSVASFAAEGQYGVDARDATWAKCYEILAEVDAGTRPVPAGFADIESELPVLAWPE